MDRSRPFPARWLASEEAFQSGGIAGPAEGCTEMAGAATEAAAEEAALEEAGAIAECASSNRGCWHRAARIEFIEASAATGFEVRGNFRDVAPAILPEASRATVRRNLPATRACRAAPVA